MKMYYWNVEKNDVISAPELFRNKAEFFPGESFGKFMDDCHSANNGNVKPLADAIREQESNLSRMDPDDTERAIIARYIASLKAMDAREFTVDGWISEREDDDFIIEDDDGRTIYDARTTSADPGYMVSLAPVVDVYRWGGLTVLSI